MTFVNARRVLAGVAFFIALLPVLASAQPTASDPMAPRQPLPGPSGIRPFPTPPEIAQRELSLDEVVAIAVENQPQIAARFGDYAAALARINQALSPLLPQVSAAATATRDDSASRVFSGGGSTFIGTVESSATGRIAASQL